VAENPWRQHTAGITFPEESWDFEVHLLSPHVMSFVNDPFNMYSAGVSHPTGGFPAASRASLTRATMAANTGADADVPESKLGVPPMNT